MTDRAIFPSAWNDRNPVATRAERVTFFEDRAEVVRRAICQVPAGTSWFTLLGVGVFVDDPSVVARVNVEGVRTLGTRVLRTMRTLPAESGEQLTDLERELREARRARVEAEGSATRVAQALVRTQALIEAWTRAVGRVPTGGESTAASWASAYESLGAAARMTLDEAATHKDDAKRAKLEEARTRLRLDQGRRVQPHYEAAIEVQVESNREQQIELELVYRTPCALWRPEHVARWIPGADQRGDELHLQTHATVWQMTGEAWDDIVCRFSTARPARAASPPLLREDIVTSRRKTEEERRVVRVEARDQEVHTAGLGRGARTVDEMPGVDDGGEPLWYEGAKRTSVPSDGQPLRVELGEVRIPCEVDRVAYPEHSEAAYYRATAALKSAGPLLAGPVWVARGASMIGRSTLRFVARGESFELGLGPDDALRIRRKTREKRETTPVIGTQKITRTVELFVSNMSGETRDLGVVERFPVSEIEDVEVKVLSHEGASLDERDGFARFDVTIPAQGTKTLELVVRIEASSRVAM